MIASVTLLVGPENQPLTLPAVLQGQIDLGITQYRTYSVVLIVDRDRDRGRRSGSASSARAWARRSAPPSTTGAWPNRSASTSSACSRSRSPSAAAWPRWAAGSAPSSSASIRSTRSNTWCIFLIVVAVGGLGRVTGVFYAALLIGVLDFVAQEVRARRAARCSSTRSRSCSCCGGRRASSEARRHDAPSPGLADHPAALALAARHRLRAWEPMPWIARARVVLRVPEASRLRHRAAGDDPLRALARPRARLCRDRDARPRRVLRRRRLHGGHAGQARHLERADHGPDRSPRWWRRPSGSAPAWCCCAPTA